MNVMQIGFLTAGAAAMTLPLWIHLLLRQRARAVDIGSIRFIEQVVRRTRSRQRIQRLLLLALRALAMLLLGLLFARPFLPDTPADGRTREVAVLIDRSASMSVADEDGITAFEKAIRRAKQHIDTLGDQSKVHLGLFDAAGVRQIGLGELDEAETSALGTRYDDGFAWATDLLTGSKRADRELMVLSDLQRPGVLHTDLTGFPADIPVRIEDVAPAVAQNLAIESAVATQIEIRPGVPVSISIEIVNHGAIPVNDVRLQIKLNGPGGSFDRDLSVSLAANERRSVNTDVKVSEPGTFYGEVIVDRSDPFQWDNRRAIAFAVRHPDRILLIDGDAGDKPWENETYFLETALRLRTPVGEGPARTFEVERLVWDRGEGFPDLDGFRLVVAANLSRFTSDDATRLATFVDGGGNVLWFPGERSTDAVQKKLSDSGVLGRSTLNRATDAVARVHQYDSAHSVLVPFAEPQHGNLRSLIANRIIPFGSVDPQAKVLIRSRRFPLVVSHRAGDGRFVFVATSVDRSWSDWPQNRLYVPLMRQLAAWLTGQLDSQPPVRTETIDRADQAPGIHLIDDSVVARVVDPAESSIGRFGVEQFRETAGLPEESLITVESDRREQYKPAGASRSDEKWPLVIWALLGILGSEFILASRVHE